MEEYCVNIQVGNAETPQAKLVRIFIV